LTDAGRSIGLVNDEDYQKFLGRHSLLKEALQYAATVSFQDAGVPADLFTDHDNSGTKLLSLLRRPQYDVVELAERVVGLQRFPRFILQRLEIEIKYEGYIAREVRAIKDEEQLERIKIPADFSFESISGLRREIVEKLNHFRPATLGQSSRISGMTPAAVQLLHMHLRNRDLLANPKTASETAPKTVPRNKISATKIGGQKASQTVGSSPVDS